MVNEEESAPMEDGDGGRTHLLN